MLEPGICSITDEKESKLIFTYTKPIDCEAPFPIEDESYFRQVWQYKNTNHLVSVHNMKISADYDGNYVDATYKSLEKMNQIFERIINLPKNESDNYLRFSEISKYAEKWISNPNQRRLLDIGSGLGVFPYTVKNAGWECFSIDPDERAIELIKNKSSIDCLCGDFMNLNPKKEFNIITLNKVLEHVNNPIERLSRVKNWLLHDGFVYIELPDGEAACRFGPEREEFTIDHLNIFSIVSTCLLAKKAGFEVDLIYRLIEPSGKYTIRCFMHSLS